MSLERALSSEESRALRSRHPLYTRLSGDVIWGLFEESGLDEEACGRAMDDFIADMMEILPVMDRLERGEAEYFVFRVKGTACDRYASLDGKAVAVANQDWRRFLPPFAVGCAVSCRALNEAELAPEACTAIQAGDLEIPEGKLICPLRYPLEK